MSRGRGRPQKYDWDKWGDGQEHLVVEGQDFDCSLVSFRALVHRTAKERFGCKAKTRIYPKEGKLMFRIIKRV